MNLKDRLSEKKAALLDLEPMLKAEDVTEDTISQGEALAAEIADLEGQIEKAEKAAAVIAKLGTKEDTTRKDNNTMTKFDEFAAKAATLKADKDLRQAGASMVDFKANTDVVQAPTLADIDRSVAPVARKATAASLFTNSTINGNAITYFLQGDIEGEADVVAQNAKKPQISTSFEPVTLPLSKVAAYIKETDEILDDAAFLATEVQNTLIAEVERAENSAVIGAIGNTSGVLAVEYTDFADGVLEGIMAIKNASNYDASVVILNPADLYAFMIAKDDNKQYIGGGYFTGAYGNGSYAMPSSIWGVPVFTSSEVPSGSAIVAAREAVKVWKKGGLYVRIYEQNEDDALYNRVTLLGEERLACAVTNLKGVALVAAKAES